MSQKQIELALGADPGLNLLNNLISATDKDGNSEDYYYDAGATMDAVDSETGKSGHVGDEEGEQNGKHWANGIDNLSTTPWDIEAQTNLKNTSCLYCISLEREQALTIN